MRFRWSGSTRQTEEETRARLKTYFEAIGFQVRPEDPELSLQRGTPGFTLNPRKLWMQVQAKIQPWGTETMVDVTFEIPSRGNLTERGAELIVSEVREMVRYLQEGTADFERLEQLLIEANRQARRVLILTFVGGMLFALGLIPLFLVLRVPEPLAPFVGGGLVGLFVGYLYSRLLRRRR